MPPDPTAPAPSPAAPALRVQGLSKVYRIWNDPAARLKAPVLAAVANLLPRGSTPARRLYERASRHFHDFHALRDVSFEVARGETVGIVGRNGAGKSTLLQIVSGVLRPTAGEVEVGGRIAALLELGSGFNPDFTGRENVFLNASILGMDRAATEARFDRIAEFAGIGEFIEQPVKIYSSGMMVRLAFAVQAFLDPDLLIVDEALAVGDLPFQHKCMQRIARLVDGGTAVLFVSHATDTVKRFCRRGLWLERGEVRYWGSAGVAVERYLAAVRMGEAAAAAPREAIAAGGGEEPEGDPLPRVAAEVDLDDPRLQIDGPWTRQEVAALRAVALSTTGGRAGFRFRGERFDLRFLEGPAAGAVAVWLDGERTVHELRAERSGARRVTLVTTPGEHAVLLQPAGAATIAWLGGSVARDPAPLEYRGGGVADSGEVAAYGSGKARIERVELLDYFSLEPVVEAALGQRLRLRIHARRLAEAGPRLDFSFIVRDAHRVDLFGTTTRCEGVSVDPRAERFTAEFAFDVRLGPGSYSVLASFVECSEEGARMVPMHQVDLACVFRVAFDPRRPVWYAFHEPTAVRVRAQSPAAAP